MQWLAQKIKSWAWHSKTRNNIAPSSIPSFTLHFLCWHHLPTITIYHTIINSPTPMNLSYHSFISTMWIPSRPPGLAQPLSSSFLPFQAAGQFASSSSAFFWHNLTENWYQLFTLLFQFTHTHIYVTLHHWHQLTHICYRKMKRSQEMSVCRQMLLKNSTLCTGQTKVGTQACLHPASEPLGPPNLSVTTHFIFSYSSFLPPS